eukprot:COSAG01_NODE_5131_length_4464_cov_150.671478_7_plen_72_part_00
MSKNPGIAPKNTAVETRNKYQVSSVGARQLELYRVPLFWPEIELYSYGIPKFETKSRHNLMRMYSCYSRYK